MQRSTIPDQTLQTLDDVIGVWEENPDFSMGPGVTLEKVKATGVQLDTGIMDAQATNRTLTKHIDDRDDCAKLGRVCGAGAQGHPGLFRSRFHAIRPGRRHPRQRPQERGPPGQGRDAAPGSIRRDDRRGRRVLPIPGARGAYGRDVGRGREAAARCRAVVERRHPGGRGGETASRATPHGRPGWAVRGWHTAPRRLFSHKGACRRNRNRCRGLALNRRP